MRILKLRPLIANCRGFSVLGWLLMIPVGIIVLLVLVFGFYEGRKAYWDSEVKTMCEKDGGVAIAHRIKLTSDQAIHLPRVNGRLSVGSEALAGPATPVFSRLQQRTLREGNPTIVRYEEEIILRADNRVVARAVIYGRSGGDFPSFAHPSRYSCPELSRVYTEISEIFDIEEKKR